METKEAIYHYCNYQERCQQQVRDKLYSLGCHPGEVEAIIADLIEKGLVNEERFARAIARGKFRMNKWGRIKIIQQLKQHRISDYCIKIGLREIDEEEYFQTLRRLAAAKWMELKEEKNIFAKKAKVFRYLQQKGFERELITDSIDTIQLKSTE
ncbi:MAG TPA: regulatory protein RecX [Flavipsychrobacter sp.]|nr:regulatory protein RecX [Flavipsychrobacter sp.]